MKRAKLQGSEIKKLYRKLARQYGKPASAPPVDPVQKLVEGILAGGTSFNKAQAVLKKLWQGMVDLNELRVTPPMELGWLIGDGVPFAQEKAQRIVDALNAIRTRQDTLDLTFLKQRGRREARDYLEALDGVDKFTAAVVVLYSLGGHAIPVDALTLYVLEKDELLVRSDSGDDIADVQSQLERAIPASDGQAFAELLNRYVVSKTARMPESAVNEIFNPPPPEPPPKPKPKAPVKEKPAEKTSPGKTKAGSSTKDTGKAKGKSPAKPKTAKSTGSGARNGGSSRAKPKKSPARSSSKSPAKPVARKKK